MLLLNCSNYEYSAVHSHWLADKIIIECLVTLILKTNLCHFSIHSTQRISANTYKLQSQMPRNKILPTRHN